MKTEMLRLSLRWISSRAYFLAVFIAVGLMQFWALDKMSFHGDESYWSTGGIKAINLVFTGKMFDSQWVESRPEYGGYPFFLFGPPVTMYLIGLGLRLFGVQSGEWPYWGRIQPWTAPPSYVLLIGRAVISLTAYAALLVTYHIGKELKDSKTGLIAVLLLGFHPLWLICGRRAMSDTPAVMFSMLALWLFWRGMKRSGRTAALSFALSGVAIAFAVDSKYTALFLTATLLAYYVFHLIATHDYLRTRDCFRIGIFLLAFIILVVGLNPFLYPNPIMQFLKVVEFWQSSSFFSHAKIINEKPYVGDASLGVMFLGTIHTILIPGISWIGKVWASYQWNWNWPGTYSSPTASLMFMLGFISVCHSISRRRWGIGSLVLACFIGNFVFVAATIRVMFERYFLPILPPLVILAALGLSNLHELAIRRRQFISQAIIPLLILSHIIGLFAFYPEIYQRAWSNPGNWPQFGTFQQGLSTPYGLTSLFLFSLGVLCYIWISYGTAIRFWMKKTKTYLQRIQLRIASHTAFLGMCTLLTISPALLLLYYIRVFGVNVVFWDDWAIIPLIQKTMNGTLSFSDLFAQHNEHRILFPRIIMLAIAGLTQYNTVAEMFFSWILICLTGFLIFYVYQKKFSWQSYPKLLLIFLPVSLLLFSFRQYESILWGFTCQMYLMIFGAVATFTLLELSKKIDIWFTLCLLSAILATFSFSVGLSVWPVGLLQILVSERRDLRKAVIWCFAGAVAFTSYFYGYIKPSHHPPLDYVLIHPLGAGRYFLTLIGASFSYDAVTAGVLGLVISLIAILVIVEGYNGKLLKGYGVWLSFVLFVAISSVAITVGRAGFGVEQALSSRYAPLTVLGVVGLYFLAVSVSEKLPAKSKSFGAHAILALILVGLIVSYGGGWLAGQNMKYSREMGAYILTTYKIQSDENIGNYLYPIPTVVREQAQFLEQNKLNVFSEKAINLSTLILSSSKTLFALDTINGKIVSQQTMPLVINSSQQGTITITGWAVDEEANDVASAVFITIDGRIDIPTLYGLDRQDIANYFKNSNFRFSGYIATFSSSILSEGEHIISLKIVSEDGVHYYHQEQVLYLVVK